MILKVNFKIDVYAVFRLAKSTKKLWFFNKIKQTHSYPIFTNDQ